MHRAGMGPKPNVASGRSTDSASTRSQHASLDRAQHPLLLLQSKIGNQAVLRQLRQHGMGGGVLARQPQTGAPQPENGAPQPQNNAPQPQTGAPQPLETGTATAEREREVEAIKVGGIDYVLYQTKARGGGSSAWLANNPGNLDYTADTVAWHCYEDKKLIWGDHRFAIFQDESTGLAAVRAFLRKYQTTRNITLMMNLFAPAGDKENNPTKYSEKVAKHIGPPVTVNTLVKDLTDDQIQLFAEAIQKQEGWTPGLVNDVPRGDPSLPDEIRNR